jgi:queuine tRNA-ribosyltransferase
MARHHALYTLGGRINIAAAQWAEHDGPVDPESVFPETGRYSASYMRHLFKASEPLGPRLATLHNLAFYARLMSEIRDAIQNGAWPELMARYSKA